MKRSGALWLALGLIVLLVANSFDFFFHRPYYEIWDLAANALAVNRAKHFDQLYGAYSRWGFHHPGPILFYIQALGEWLFYDTLHLCPAPFNAQTLLHVGMMVGWFVLGLAIFARWLPEGERVLFVPAAVCLGALHFGVMANLPSFDPLRNASAFSSVWPIHVLVLPFVCLLAACASVAAGRGEHLPVVALTGGFLVQLHLVQTLFVVTLTLLAYAGLLWQRNREDAVRGIFPLSTKWSSRRWWHAVSAWRATPWAHALAGILILFFMLPILLDLFRGTDSNFAAILRHLRTYHEEHKPWSRSWLYFLQFAAYTPFAPHSQDFAGADHAGTWAYLRAHAAVLAAWLGAAVLILLALVWPMRAAGQVLDEATRRRVRFLAWTAGFALASTLLTLYWGTRQDGDMFYYNAWFNFGIYYFAALVAVAQLIALFSRREPGLTASRGFGPWVGWTAGVAAGAVCLALAGRFRISDAAPDYTRRAHAGVARMITGQPADALTVFSFPTDAWPCAAGVGLQLERSGRRFAVPLGSEVIFGDRRVWSAYPTAVEYTALGWRFGLAPQHTGWGFTTSTGFAAYDAAYVRDVQAYDRLAVAGAAPPLPLLNGVTLTSAVAALPFTGTERAAMIDCRPAGNSDAFVVGGWGDVELWGRWSVGSLAVLCFRADPVPPSESVEITAEVSPLVAPPAGLQAQRVGVRINGEPMGELRCDHATTLTWIVPAATWNRAATVAGSPGVTLTFALPDAASPASLDPSGVVRDGRPLGVGFKTIRFHPVEAAAPRPAVGQADPAASISFSSAAASRSVTSGS